MPKKKIKNLFWRRGFAFLIDIIIIQFIVSLSFNKLIEKQLNIQGNIFEIYQVISNNSQQLVPLFTYISIITAIIAILYFTALEFKIQQTIGKMLFNLKIKAIKGKITLKQAFIRNISKSLFFVNGLILVLILDLIYMFFKKERLFDKWAKTKVIFTN